MLAATLAELVEVGYAGLRFEAVASRAGVHKTTVYRRWPDRSSLVAEALLVQRDADVPVPDTGALEGDLRALARSVGASIRSPTGAALARMLVLEAGRPSVAALAQEFWHERLWRAGTVVARAVARGELPADTDADLLVEALIGPLYFRALLVGAPVDDAHVDRLVDLLLVGARA